jgi:hypothetical protein
MKNIKTPPSDRRKSMIEPITTNQHLLKIRAYLLETISQAADQIKEIDDLLKQN